jgi:dTMP kinase
MRKTFGAPPPGFSSEHLRGHLIVLEGADGSGRTTEVDLLRDWLEIRGHPVVDTGLRRSTLVGPEIDRAKQGHPLSATTMALFYAADFADQLENKILPSLAAGSTVLADRYVYTLMARAVVRGATRDWASKLYGFGIVPDLTVFLDARPEILLHRAIGRYGSLDYWESGMDLSLSRDRFESGARVALFPNHGSRRFKELGSGAVTLVALGLIPRRLDPFLSQRILSYKIVDLFNNINIIVRCLSRIRSMTLFEPM